MNADDLPLHRIKLAARESPNLKRLIAVNAVHHAAEDVGKGEVGGNNAGPYIRQLLDGKEAAWCAGAVWTWHARSAAELGAEFHRIVPRTHGARRLYTLIGRSGLFLTRPVIGAVACWDRGRLAWQAHVELVEWVDGDRFGTIAGNVGPFPAVVQRRERRLIEPKLEGFAVLT